VRFDFTTNIQWLLLLNPKFQKCAEPSKVTNFRRNPSALSSVLSRKSRRRLKQKHDQCRWIQPVPFFLNISLCPSFIDRPVPSTMGRSAFGPSINGYITTLRSILLPHCPALRSRTIRCLMPLDRGCMFLTLASHLCELHLETIFCVSFLRDRSMSSAKALEFEQLNQWHSERVIEKEIWSGRPVYLPRGNRPLKYDREFLWVYRYVV
jgi:hypothetical protein